MNPTMPAYIFYLDSMQFSVISGIPAIKASLGPQRQFASINPIAMVYSSAGVGVIVSVDLIDGDFLIVRVAVN